jgi:hypothetical protein
VNTGGQRLFLEKKKHCKDCIRHSTNGKIHPYVSVLKLALLGDLQQRVGELVLSVTSFPSIIILENTLN